MNKIRRQEICSVISTLNGLIQRTKNGDKNYVVAALNDIIDDINTIYCDEEEYKDNIPENLQSGYRYESAEEACDNLESAQDALEYIDEDDSEETIINSLQEAIGYLDDASC